MAGAKWPDGACRWKHYAEKSSRREERVKSYSAGSHEAGAWLRFLAKGPPDEALRSFVPFSGTQNVAASSLAETLRKPHGNRPENKGKSNGKRLHVFLVPLGGIDFHNGTVVEK